MSQSVTLTVKHRDSIMSRTELVRVNLEGNDLIPFLIESDHLHRQYLFGVVPLDDTRYRLDRTYKKVARDDCPQADRTAITHIESLSS